MGNSTFPPDLAAKMHYEQRLLSFEHWRPYHQPKEKMAEAGFYYYNLRDCVKCFCCGCILSNWEPFDDPWEQHALWFPGCMFVLLSKGQDFITRVHSQVKKYSYSPGNFTILRPQKLKILYICWTPPPPPPRC